MADAAFDLRSWIEQVRALGELKEVAGVSADLEIGTVVDILMEKPGNPAVLFNDIPGYARGMRLLGNVLTSRARVAISGGLDPGLSKLEVVGKWRELSAANCRLPCTPAPGGPAMGSTPEGADVGLCAYSPP